jgi:hypothetical protein
MKDQLYKLINNFQAIPLKDNKEIADSFWVTFENKTGTAEGKIHIPHKGQDKLVIFEPGFPGGGSGYFEELFLRKVLESGYTTFLIRHAGTIINGKHSSGYIVCKEKQRAARLQGQKTVGVKKSHSIADWLVEPKVALEILVPYFNAVILVGHSFGPLANFSSLIDFVKENPKLAKKVRRFISMAGTLGIVRNPKERILSQWKEYLDKAWSRERVLIGNTEDNVKSLHNTYKKIYKEIGVFPEDVDFIVIHPWGDRENTTDELVHVVESLEMITSLERGYLIIDKMEHGDKKTGRIAHDMKNLKPEIFQKLVDLRWLPEQQITTIK